MKLLYLHQYFNLPYMVGSTRSLELARGFISAGYEVEVITARREKGYIYPSNFENLKIDWLDVPYSNEFGYFKRLMAFLKFILLTSFKVLSKDYDLIYVSSTPLTIIIPALIAKILRKKKYIFEVRDLWPEIPIAMGYVRSTTLKYFLRKLSYFGYKHSVAIVPLSNDMANQIMIRYNINPTKIFVLPNFSSSQYFNYSSTEIFEARNEVLKDTKQRIIIYPGTFGHVNGLEYIISLAAELSDSSYVFLALGSGREMKKILRLIDDKKLDNIFVLNSVPKFEVFKYIAASDYLISTVIDIPELNWNSANKYFDGLCAGKPVIINHEGWQAIELKSTLSGIVIGKDIKYAGMQLKSVSDADYDKMKRNVVVLSKKYEKEIIIERLIKIIQNDKEIPNMY